MENKINKKVSEYLRNFKCDIKDWFDNNNSYVDGDKNINEFLNFVYEYENLSLIREDYEKKKRAKNTISLNLRCCAIKSNGEQCTRKKKDNCQFCGTHEKGSPNGLVSNNVDEETTQQKKIQIWIQNINGINYYLDNSNNIYNHCDILNDKPNPTIIGKYITDNNNNYFIKEFYDN